MQVTIARQLGLEPTTVGNFFMNARRRSMDKWKDENDGKNGEPTKFRRIFGLFDAMICVKFNLFTHLQCVQ